jgi:hypothetical protein
MHNTLLMAGLLRHYQSVQTDCILLFLSVHLFESARSSAVMNYLILNTKNYGFFKERTFFWVHR